MLSVSNGKGILCQHVKLFCFNILVIQILMGWFFRLHSRESGGLNRRGYVGIFALPSSAVALSFNVEVPMIV